MASRKKNYNAKQVLENLELWQSLTKEEQVYLESNIEFINYKKNSIIYSDGIFRNPPRRMQQSASQPQYRH